MIFRQEPKSGLVFFARNGHFLTFWILKTSYFINVFSHSMSYLDKFYATPLLRNAFSKIENSQIWQASTDKYEMNGCAALKNKDLLKLYTIAMKLLQRTVKACFIINIKKKRFFFRKSAPYRVADPILTYLDTFEKNFCPI